MAVAVCRPLEFPISHLPNELQEAPFTLNVEACQPELMIQASASVESAALAVLVRVAAGCQGKIHNELSWDMYIALAGNELINSEKDTSTVFVNLSWQSVLSRPALEDFLCRIITG
jgi:hypothetical protein